jgi:hypothetical protein
MNQSYEYKYDPLTYAFRSFSKRTDMANILVSGHELGPDGAVYLATLGDYWGVNGQYSLDLAIRVYR